MQRAKKNCVQFDKISESFRIEVQKQIDNFLCKELGNSLEFPTNLSNIERAYIHEYIKPLGLTSKSHGQNDNRRVTIYKRTQHTNTEFKELHLSEKSRTLLQEQILTQNTTEDFAAEASLDQGSKATIPLVNVKSHGNLVGKLDSTMVPPRPRRNDFWRETQNLPIQNYRDLIIQTLNKSSVNIICISYIKVN